MRILLAQNSLYYPAHGGGDKSNRLLMEALAARGHVCRAVARIPVFGAAEEDRYVADLAARGVTPYAIEGGVIGFSRADVYVHVVTGGGLRAYFTGQMEAFRPDVILASTDDPAQALLAAALEYPGARVVYLSPSLRPGLRDSEPGGDRAAPLGGSRGGRQRIRGALRARPRGHRRHSRSDFAAGRGRPLGAGPVR
jgi:hypothetical protein